MRAANPSPSPFVADALARAGLACVPITEAYMTTRLADVQGFVNAIVAPVAERYRWTLLDDAYFLNPMDRKWAYSFAFEAAATRQLALVNLTSVYDDHLHLHALYAGASYRGRGLGTLSMLQQAEAGLQDGFTEVTLWCAKQNRRALLFYLHLGCEVETMRDDQEVGLRANLHTLAEQARTSYLAAHT